MKKLTKVLSIILATTLMTVPVMASTITLNINGSVITTTVAPYQSNGTTLVPLRVVSENLGAKVDWNQQTKTVTITQDATIINLTLGSKIAKVNGEEKTLNLAPQIKNNTTMVPIRFVSENLNCDVNWDKETQTVSVTGKAKIETVVSEDGSFVIKNPQMLAGIPILTVDWMEQNLGAHVTYYPQWNRYIVISENRDSKVVISEKNRWMSINSAHQPYLGDYDCGNDKSTAKISIDIVAKSYGYEWNYDEVTKTLTCDKIDKTLVLQEPVNGYVTIKGYVKYLDTQEAASNITMEVAPRIAGGAIRGYYKATTDENGYYECKIAISEVNRNKWERVSVKYYDGSIEGRVEKVIFPEEKPDGYYPSIYTDTMPVIYLER